MEVLFEDIGTSPKPSFEEGLDEAYAARVKELIQDAQAYEDDTLSLVRIENLRYFEGEEPEKPDEGRTTVVSTDARDTVMAIIPSLMRIFGASEHVLNFVPTSPHTADAAETATTYVKYVFWEDNDGFLNLYEAFYDATSKNTGIWKWWTDDDHEMSYKNFSNLTMEQLQYMLMEDPDLEIVEMTPAEDSDDPLAPVIETMTVRHTVSKPTVRIETVPPEEFRISRSAKSIKKATLVGHSRMVSPSDILQKGYTWSDFDTAMGFTDLYTDEKWYRNTGADNAVEQDDYILFGEYYIYIDQDGDGIDELRYIRTVGDDFLIIDDQPASHVKFAGICPSPIPHTAIGDSIVEQVKEIQRVRTNLLRSGLDSLADTLDPTTVYNPALTNTADVMDTAIGKYVRTKGDPSTALYEQRKQFVGQSALEAYGMMETMRAARTGISEASKGLDPKAMQSTNLLGIETIVTGAQERIELVARIFAETGIKDLFRGILREVIEHPNHKRQIEVAGKWIEIEPSLFDPNMKCRVNPTLGKGGDTVRLQALSAVLERQEMILTKYGLKNPFVTPVEYRNAIEDNLALVNIRNTDRYFRRLTPEIVQQIMEAPETPDPAQILATAELEGVRAKAAKDVANKNFEYDELAVNDDFRRDKLVMDSAVKLEELGAREREQEIARNNSPLPRTVGAAGAPS